MSKTIKRPLPSSTLRMLILNKFYRAWELHADPNDYFPIQQVWDGIYAKQKTRVDGPLVQGAFNGLLKEEFLRATDLDGIIAAQITDQGRSYREDLLQRRRTRLLAYLAAVIGIMNLLWNVVSKLFPK